MERRRKSKRMELVAKYTWGKPGDEDIEIPVDKKDPSYVSPTEED